MKIRKRQVRALLDALWKNQTGADGALIGDGEDVEPRVMTMDEANKLAMVDVYERQVNIEKAKVRELQDELEIQGAALKHREVENTGMKATLQKLNGQQDLFVRIARAIDMLMDAAYHPDPKRPRRKLSVWTAALSDELRREFTEIRKALRW